MKEQRWCMMLSGISKNCEGYAPNDQGTGSKLPGFKGGRRSKKRRAVMRNSSSLSLNREGWLGSCSKESGEHKNYANAQWLHCHLDVIKVQPMYLGPKSGKGSYEASMASLIG